MASLIIHYCQSCGRRIDKAEIRGGHAIQYRDNWYCPACKDAASEHAPLDPSAVSVNPGLQTKDDDPEVTLSDLFAPVAAAPRRATTARKVAPPRAQTASAKRSPQAKAPVPDGSTAVRKPKAPTQAGSGRKPAGAASGRARGTPVPHASPPDPGSGRKARGSDTPASHEAPAPSRVPPAMLVAMGGTILALLAVIVFLLARQGATATPPSAPPRPADPPGAGSPVAPPPADPALVRAVEALEGADATETGRWRSRREGWAALLGRAAGTALEPRVREGLTRLEAEIDREARLQLDAIKASIAPFVDAGRTEEAVVRLESFDEELRTPRWQAALDAEIARIRAAGK